MYCARCGAEVDDRAAFCGRCGTAIQGPQAGSAAGAATSAYPAATENAGFWRRVGAGIIDWLITSAVLFVVDLPFDVTPFSSWDGDFDAPGRVGRYVGANVVSVVLLWLYSAFMESSRYQATLGKMLLGIVVTDMNGRRISFGRATGRHFAKILSAIILLIGYFMIAFTEKKQGLHDMIAGTLVVKKQ